jgi:hypothetical protein
MSGSSRKRTRKRSPPLPLIGKCSRKGGIIPNDTRLGDCCLACRLMEPNSPKHTEWNRIVHNIPSKAAAPSENAGMTVDGHDANGRH